MSFWRRVFNRPEPEPSPARPLSMADFLTQARSDVEVLISRDPNWYVNLPYPGAISIQEAKEYEIEKLAVWRRVIHDAKRTDLPGLRWSSRLDEKTCPECRANHDRLFNFQDYEALAALPKHLGCRCELVPVRRP